MLTKIYFNTFTYLYHNELTVNGICAYIRKNVLNSDQIMLKWDDAGEMVSIVRDSDLQECYQSALRSNAKNIKIFLHEKKKNPGSKIHIFTREREPEKSLPAIARAVNRGNTLTQTPLFAKIIEESEFVAAPLEVFVQNQITLLYEEIEWEVEEDAQFNPFDLGEPTASQLPEEMDAFLELYQQPPLGKIKLKKSVSIRADQLPEQEQKQMVAPIIPHDEGKMFKLTTSNPKIFPPSSIGRTSASPPLSSNMRNSVTPSSIMKVSVNKPQSRINSFNQENQRFFTPQEDDENEDQIKAHQYYCDICSLKILDSKSFFQCKQCPSIDICNNCKEQKKHKSNHELYEVKPESEPELTLNFQISNSADQENDPKYQEVFEQIMQKSLLQFEQQVPE